MGGGSELQLGREAHDRHEWAAAHEQLHRADDGSPLGSLDLELLATSAYMLGDVDGYLAALERAHQTHLNEKQSLAAADAAIWIGLTLAQQGEMGRAGGWLARARRLVDRETEECPHQGYLLLPQMFAHKAAGDLEGAITAAAAAAEIGYRFADPDLLALAVHSHGHMLVSAGRVHEGLPLLDEAMVAVTRGEPSPIVCGIVYCGVILACREAFEADRAREWTAALAEWCGDQPDMVAFTGRCLVHRTELMQLRGAWHEALVEGERAVSRCLAAHNSGAAGAAHYLRGEVLRLQGEHAAAEVEFEHATRLGHEPHPGLALLRRDQGHLDKALGAIRRALAEATRPPARAALLPALAELELEAKDSAAAEVAVRELEEIATANGGDLLAAVAATARASVRLAVGAVDGALRSSRTASELWQRLEAPYETARARELVARACRELGDEDSAGMELAAASEVFSELEAHADRARVQQLLVGKEPGTDLHGLSPRELEVLRLVAAGNTNRAIADQLVLSERTVERHVSNLCAKLRVDSRTAATAFAYEHGLIQTS